MRVRPIFRQRSRLADATDAMVKFIAGGQSLGPMLNLRLVQPDLLVDITAIAELKRVEQTADALILGSCITHADIEDGRVPDVTGGAMRSVAAGIAYRAVRNRGTIGGSLVHADPSADWMSALACARRAGDRARCPPGASHSGRNRSMTGVFECSLAAGELLTGVEVPASLAPGALGLLQALPQDRRACACHRRLSATIPTARSAAP